MKLIYHRINKFQDLKNVPSTAGVEIDIRYHHEVIKVTDHGDHVSAISNSGEEEKFITGKYLVGCDGSRSRVRKSLGSK